MDGLPRPAGRFFWKGDPVDIRKEKDANHGAELFIFDEPTVGVDVGTKVEIYKLFATLLKAGAGIILISSYLPEVYDLSDTLHVFRRGRLVSSHIGEKAAHENILTEAIGV